MPVQKKGFTLVELLVTISIVGILSTIGLVVYSTALKQGRDSKRQSDLKSIQLALEQYVNDQGFYPYQKGTSPFTPGNALTNQTGNPTTLVPPLKIYMSIIPNDADTTTPYKYQAINSSGTACNNSSTPCVNYCLFAKLENPPSSSASLPTGCVYPAHPNMPSVFYDFAVTSP